MEPINELFDVMNGIIDDFSDWLLNNVVWRFFIDGLDLILNSVSSCVLRKFNPVL